MLKTVKAGDTVKFVTRIEKANRMAELEVFAPIEPALATA
jgi:hypothetical protein